METYGLEHQKESVVLTGKPFNILAKMKDSLTA